MNAIDRRLEAAGQPSYRILLAVTSAIMIVASLTAVKRAVEPDTASNSGQLSFSGGDAVPGSPEAIALAAEAESRAAEAARRAGDRSQALVGAKPGDVITLPDGTIATIPPGVTDDEIHVVYYWKGDRTSTSPYLQGANADGNVDEGKAFEVLVEWINRHDGDGTEIMGIPIDLHGRKLRGEVIDAGQGAEVYATTAQYIAEEAKPFAAIAAHGSISDYICPTLAAVGIHNFSTYDLGGQLVQRTNGYCLPSGLPWERQVNITEKYLLAQARVTKYVGPESNFQPVDRRYGVIYAEYPGLKRSAPAMIERLKRAGVPIEVDVAISESLTDSQQQVSSVVGKMREKEVNTLIFPDAGAPLNFTHQSEALQYRPDYFVWPCSGTDNVGMVRLYDANQWSRASGLTCYDKEFNPDLTHDSMANEREAHKAYIEITGSNDVPSPTILVYAALSQLVAGVSGAGRDLVLENFRGALDAVAPYRYDSIDGPTDDASNLLVALGDPDRAMIGDVAKVVWNPARENPGGTTLGNYDYPETVRYLESAAF